MLSRVDFSLKIIVRVKVVLYESSGEVLKSRANIFKELIRGNATEIIPFPTQFSYRCGERVKY